MSRIVSSQMAFPDWHGVRARCYAGGENDEIRRWLIETLEVTLDVTGLRCPLPVLRAGKALRSLPAGALLRVLATDPMAALDMPHFCHESGHDLLSATETESGGFLFVIRRGPDVRHQ